MVIYSWVFADIFSKIIKMILSLQEKRLMVFVANDKMICCQLKIQNLENLYFHYHELDNIPLLKEFLISCDINRCDIFKISYIMECFNILEDVYNSMNQYFPNDQCLHVIKSGK